MTPHIKAAKEDIAKVVLMPGDPLRAKFIAENFLQNIKLVNSVRNMFMYTGTYKGTRVTIAGSGMGNASAGIYSYELFKFYDVDAIMRIGSCGAYSDKLKIKDIVLSESAYSESTYAKTAFGINEDIVYPDKELLATIEAVAQEQAITIHKARIHASDVFYNHQENYWQQILKNHNCDCVEMESLALFSNANALGKKAATLLTVSDCLYDGSSTSPEERQNTFTTMMKLALETALKLAK